MSTVNKQFDSRLEWPASFCDVLPQNADAFGSRTAFTFFRRVGNPVKSVTYEGLYREARAVGAFLQSHGLRGERVVLFFDAGLDFVSAFLGCALAGVVAVPLPLPRLRRRNQRIESVLHDCDARAVLCTQDIQRQLESERDLLDHDGLRFVLAVEDAKEHGGTFHDVSIYPDELALLQYTSGSTGTPKGVMVTHANLIANVRAMAERLACTPEDIGVSWLPHFHDMGLIGGILLPLAVGFETVLFPPLSFVERPISWLETISKYRATISGGPNFAYDVCERRATSTDIAALDLGSWRLAFSGSEMVQPTVLERFVKRFRVTGFREEALLPVYGLAETTLFVSGRAQDEPPRKYNVSLDGLQEGRAKFMDLDNPEGKRIVSCGRPAERHDVVVVDPESGKPLEEGRVGEVSVAGPSVTSGYWNRNHRFYVAPESRPGAGTTRYLRTGDLGFLSGGEVFITGRIKDLIILRGANVYPDDIEASVERSHPAVHRDGVAAFSIELDDQECAGVIVEIARDQLREFSFEDLVESVREAVSTDLNIQLSLIVAVTPSRIPRTSSGKKQRSKCREDWKSGKLGGLIAEWRFQPDAPTSPETEGKSVTIVEEQEEDLSAPVALNAGKLKAIRVKGGKAERARAIAPVDQEADSRRIDNDPIAVVGMACRFPQANNLGDFDQLLRSGADAITEVPGDRWNLEDLTSNGKGKSGETLSRWGGFLDQISMFDADFFGITPREAKKMDPQQRLLLEVTWSALEDAGISAERIRSSHMGVFVGIGNSDYSTVNILAAPRFSEVDAYSGTGNAHSVAANRISYLLDLRGPSLAIDTACSSSVVALHYACQSILTGESDSAIVGGVNAILSPHVSIAFANARMLSPDGRCFAFDARANGYVRSEGCGVVVLKRLSQAMRDGDRVLGVIRGTAVNHVGHGTGITVPDADAQREVMLSAMRQGNVSIEELSYIEAHGTGTPLGDPVELSAIRDAFTRSGHPTQPCMFGSVKGNVGHLETASGMAGLIKVLLMLNKGCVYPQANFSELNPNINLSETGLKLATEYAPWNTEAAQRVAGLSSFGFGGTNAHAVIAEPPHCEADSVTTKTRPIQLLTVAAHSAEAASRMANSYSQRLADDPSLDLATFSYSANTARGGYLYRSLIVGEGREAVQAGLARLAGKTTARPAVSGSGEKGALRSAFLFTGQGSQYPQMGRELYETQPAFRASIDRCSELLEEEMDRRLVDILYGEGDDADAINLTKYAQPAIFAIEWSIAQLWKSWGIRPDVLIGHSVGEFAAACVAGVFTLEEGLRLIAARGRLMGELSGKGGMAVVMTSAKRISPWLEKYKGRVSLAAVNGPRLTVISGEQEALDLMIEELKGERISAKPLNVSEAFHSALVEPMLDEFERIARSVEYNEPTIPLISNVTGRQLAKGEVPDAAYWRSHARNPVLFETGMKELANHRVDVYLEVGPSPNLVSMGRTCISAGKARWLPSLRPGQSDWQVIAKSLQTMYETGFEIDWHEFDRPYRPHRVELPEYPFERDHYWIDQATDWYRGDQSAATHPLLGSAVGSEGSLDSFEATVQTQTHAWLEDHKLFGASVFPAAAYVEMGWATARELSRTTVVRVEEISLRQVLSIGGPQPVKVRVQTQSRESLRPKFQVYSQHGTDADTPWTLHATGTVASHGWMAASRRMATADVNEIRELCPDAVCVETFYRALSQRGLEYSGDFCSIRELSVGSANALGLVNANDQFAEDARYCISPALLDAGLQVLGAAAISQVDNVSVMYCPTHIGAATLYCRPTGKVWLHATIEAAAAEESSRSLRGAVAFIDEEGRVCARLENVLLTAVGGPVEKGADTEPSTEGVTALTTRWQMIDPIPSVAGTQVLESMEPETWIVLADRSGLGSAMASRLRRAGQRCLSIYAGATSLKIDEETFECRWQDHGELRRLVSMALEGVPAGGSSRLVHLWSLDLEATSNESLPAEFDWLTSASVIDAVQACVERGAQQLPMLVATRRGHIVNRAPEEGTPFQTLTWGAVRQLGQQVRQLAPTLVDLDVASSPADDVDALLNEFLCRPAHEVALRGMDAWTPMLQVDEGEDPASAQLIPTDLLSDAAAAYRLQIGTSQTVEGIETIRVERTPVAAGHVEIEVAAAGVNFSDVLKTLGLYPHQDGGEVALGLECVGTISAIGEGVDGFEVGDRVMALAPHTFGRWVQAPLTAVVRCPGELDDLTAAGMPVAYTTALYSLQHLARLRKGDRVLIHSASGGLGHAAIHIAQRAGAEIFVTAGSEQKRAHLRSLGLEQVYDSRTTDFADAILEATDGEGIDVVLNSLGGEFVPRSVALLRPCGRFIDLAKTDVFQNPGLDRSRFSNNLAYFSVDMDQLYRTSQRVIGDLMSEMLDYVGESNCPHTSFAMTETRSAFRLMGQRRHLGKLVLTAPTAAETIPSNELFDGTTDYIIAGPIGNFAKSWIDWMHEQGARQFTFVSIADEAALTDHRPTCVDADGVTIRCREGVEAPDGSSLAEVVRAASKSSKSATALVCLSPAMEPATTGAPLPSALAEHVAALWMLHRSTLDGGISRFLMVHPFFGADAESTLGATLAAFADAVAADRWQLGLHSQSIALDLSEFMREEVVTSGETDDCGENGDQHREAAWSMLRDRLATDDPAVTITNLAEERVKERFPHRVPAILSGLIQGPQGVQPTTEGVVGEVSLAAHLRQNPPGERKVVLLDHFVQMLARVTSQEASRIKPQASIRRLGLDSLMTMELKNSIEADLSINMNLSVLFQDPSIEQLVEYALDLWQTSGNSTERHEALTGSAPSESGTELPIG